MPGPLFTNENWERAAIWSLLVFPGCLHHTHGLYSLNDALILWAAGDWQHKQCHFLDDAPFFITIGISFPSQAFQHAWAVAKSNGPASSLKHHMKTGRLILSQVGGSYRGDGRRMESLKQRGAGEKGQRVFLRKMNNPPPGQPCLCQGVTCGGGALPMACMGQRAPAHLEGIPHTWKEIGWPPLLTLWSSPGLW